MAREKGMGSLQQEKSGRWTARIGYKGKRISRSTRTTDKAKAERFLQRMLAPLGLGERRLPLADVWLEYVKSPNRNDLAAATLKAKQGVWMHFARWMERHHLEIDDLAGVTGDAIAEYLACLRLDVCASTYNGRVCVLREIFHVLANKAGLEEDPWGGVRLRVDDSHSRRELTLDELSRLLAAAEKADVMAKAKASDVQPEWKLLFLIGIYTGLRLGDCCRLQWSSVNLELGIIQLVPTKTRRHRNGRPVTIPLHPELADALRAMKAACGNRSPDVMPTMGEKYVHAKWYVTHGVAEIFRSANITMSVKLEGRRHKTPEASFHSLRHTFVSLAANAGVPLHVVQSIVGHESTAMTRHYYHENEAALRSAVAAIPSFSRRMAGGVQAEEAKGGPSTDESLNLSPETMGEIRRLYENLRKVVG